MSLLRRAHFAVLLALLAGCGRAKDSPIHSSPVPPGSKQVTKPPEKEPGQIEPPGRPAGPLEGKIAFTSYRGGAAQIHVMNADGSNVERLRLGLGPAWSPDGKHIAFNLFYNDTNRFEVVVMDAAGKNLERITRSSAGDSRAAAWSPDGRSFLYMSGDFNKPQISAMDRDGTNQRALTPPGGNDRHPSWAPDGKRFVFSSEREGGGSLYVADAAGKVLQRLTAESARCVQPAWSPDGKYLACAAHKKRTWSLRVIEVESGNWWTLLENDRALGAPAWSPASDWIAFEMERDKHKDIYVIDISGAGLQNLTGQAKADGSPSWHK